MVQNVSVSDSQLDLAAPSIRLIEHRQSASPVRTKKYTARFLELRKKSRDAARNNFPLHIYLHDS